MLLWLYKRIKIQQKWTSKYYFLLRVGTSLIIGLGLASEVWWHAAHSSCISLKQTYFIANWKKKIEFPCCILSWDPTHVIQLDFPCYTVLLILHTNYSVLRKMPLFVTLCHYLDISQNVLIFTQNPCISLKEENSPHNMIHS